MSLAQDMANTFSKDKEKRVGCILLDPKTLFIRATGYNGTALGASDSDEKWMRPNKQFHIMHAELNAICAAARHGTSLEGSVCVVTYHPCSSCARALIQAGVSHVVTRNPQYDHPRWGHEFTQADELFKETGVGVTYCGVSCGVSPPRDEGAKGDAAPRDEERCPCPSPAALEIV